MTRDEIEKEVQEINKDIRKKKLTFNPCKICYGAGKIEYFLYGDPRLGSDWRTCDKCQGTGQQLIMGAKK